MCDVYCDSSLASEADRSSTWGYILRIGDGPISWKSKKHKSTRLSTSEAAYVAMSEAAREVRWICNIYQELALETNAIVIHQDNQSAVNMAAKPKFSPKTFTRRNPLTNLISWDGSYDGYYYAWLPTEY